LKSQLETLGSEFTARDNPVYLSPVLLNTSEELESVVNMFMSDNRQATRMYIVLDSFPAPTEL
jgi:RND superfamily putative drug exporter